MASSSSHPFRSKKSHLPAVDELILDDREKVKCVNALYKFDDCLLLIADAGFVLDVFAKTKNVSTLDVKVPREHSPMRQLLHYMELFHVKITVTDCVFREVRREADFGNSAARNCIGKLTKLSAEHCSDDLHCRSRDRETLALCTARCSCLDVGKPLLIGSVYNQMLMKEFGYPSVMPVNGGGWALNSVSLKLQDMSMFADLVRQWEMDNHDDLFQAFLSKRISAGGDLPNNRKKKAEKMIKRLEKGALKHAAGKGKGKKKQHN